MSQSQHTPEDDNQLDVARADYMRDYRLTRADELKASKAQHHQAQKRHVDDVELDRLRTNPPESLKYGPQEKEQVCLNCGALFDGGKSGRANVGRHIAGCPKKPEWYRERKSATAAYKEHWGFNRTNPLASSEWSTHHSVSITASEEFQAAKRDKGAEFIAPLGAERTRRSEAKAKGEPLLRGPMRSEGRANQSRAWSGGLRPGRQKVSRRQLLSVLERHPSITDAAKELGLTPYATYCAAKRFGYDWGAEEPDFKPVSAFLAELRKRMRAMPSLPTPDEILNIYVKERLAGVPAFVEFAPFIPAFGAELSPALITKLALTRQNGALFTIANQILKRSRGALPVVDANAVSTEPVPKKVSSQKSRKFGPDKTPAMKTVWFEIGRQIEEMISNGMELEQARRKVGRNRTCEYDTIVRYHRRYRTYKHTHPGQS